MDFKDKSDLAFKITIWGFDWKTYALVKMDLCSLLAYKRTINTTRAITALTVHNICLIFLSLMSRKSDCGMWCFSESPES